MNAEIDVRSVLPSIHVPTLVMNRRSDPVANIEAARDLASKIQGAKFVEFPGSMHSAHGIYDQVLSEIEEFVTGTRSHKAFDRVLATILFLDIVGSTEHLARMGDRKWHEVLNQHNAIVRNQLTAFRGHEVKTTGDGFVSTFDGPTRAIECAKVIRDSVRQLGIEVRAGLHTGECELMGGEVGGIAVHMAARVANVAGPSQILVSDTVRGLVAGSGLGLVDHGIHPLKGVPGESRLYLVD
jgi:class 3 adenylate cyclase